MPLYEYHCNDCGEDFEKMVRFSEADKKPICPQCDSEETQKKISVFASLSASFATSTGSSSKSSCGSGGGFS